MKVRSSAARWDCFLLLPSAKALPFSSLFMVLGRKPKAGISRIRWLRFYRWRCSSNISTVRKKAPSSGERWTHRWKRKSVRLRYKSQEKPDTEPMKWGSGLSGLLKAGSVVDNKIG